nr:hypothetical protein [Tanacetum cinerariifolium]
MWLMLIPSSRLEQEHQGCAGKEAAFVEKLTVVEKKKDGLLDKIRAYKDRIKQLKEAIASKTSSMSEAENVAGTLKGDLERLTVDLNHAEIGVKVECFIEDDKAILADAIDYDPECKATFMSAFDALITKSYPYVKRITESFRLPLGDLQNIWPEGEGLTVASCALGWCSSLGYWHLDSSEASCTSRCSSLGHWHLDSSRASYALGIKSTRNWLYGSVRSSYSLPEPLLPPFFPEGDPCLEAAPPHFHPPWSS